MATTAPAASNPRWTEPGAGSAFGGGRGGRRGGGGGRRGGGGGRSRGSARKASEEASADTPSGSTATKDKEPPKEEASTSKKDEPKQAEVKKEEPKKEEKPTLEARITDKKRGSKPTKITSTPASTPAPLPATTTSKENPRSSRRRSAQPVAQPTAPAPPVINTSVPKINIAATSSPTSAKKRRATRPSPLKPSSSQSSLLAPHTAPLPPAAAKGLAVQPPKSARADIDAFVERARASVINGSEGRPSTPGSHIDWAGDDEDDGLPDLDDWGVTSVKDASQEVEMISPIIVDGLKLTPLPDLQPIPHTEGELSATSSPKLHVHPSLPSKPQAATPVLPHSRRDKGAGIRPVGRGGKNSTANSRNPTAPPSPNPTPKYLNVNGNGPPPPRNPSPHPRPPPSPRFQNLMPHPHSPNPYAQPAPFVHPYSRAHTPLQPPPANDGLSASIHAPKPADAGEITFASISGSFTDHTHTTPTPSFKELDDNANKKNEGSIGGGETAFDRHLLSATHGRAHSTGRPFFGNPRFREGRGGNFNGGGRGFDKFGNGNGHVNGDGQGSVNGSGNGNGHARTQSAPPRRPIITGDAISRLARTINGAKPVAAKEG